MLRQPSLFWPPTRVETLAETTLGPYSARPAKITVAVTDIFSPPTYCISRQPAHAELWLRENRRSAARNPLASEHAPRSHRRPLLRWFPISCARSPTRNSAQNSTTNALPRTKRKPTRSHKPQTFSHRASLQFHRLQNAFFHHGQDISDHNGRLFAHQQVQPQPRRATLGHPCRHPLRKLNPKCRASPLPHNLESSLLQSLAILFPGSHKTCLFAQRPWCRIANRARSSPPIPGAPVPGAHDIEYREHCLRLHHPPHFPKNACFVRNVHPYVNHVRPVERAPLKRHVQGAPLPKFRQTIQLCSLRQIPGHAHKLFRQVDPRNSAAVFSRKVACWPANPAPHIEQPHPRAQLHLPGQILRSLQPAHVKFVHRGQIARRTVFRILPLPSHRAQDQLFQSSPPIVPSNFRLTAHVDSSPRQALTPVKEYSFVAAYVGRSTDHHSCAQAKRVG